MSYNNNNNDIHLQSSIASSQLPTAVQLDKRNKSKSSSSSSSPHSHSHSHSPAHSHSHSHSPTAFENNTVNSHSHSHSHSPKARSPTNFSDNNNLTSGSSSPSPAHSHGHSHSPHSNGHSHSHSPSTTTATTESDLTNGHSHSHSAYPEVSPLLATKKMADKALTSTEQNSYYSFNDPPRSPVERACAGMGPKMSPTSLQLHDANAKARRKLIFASILCFCFMIGEIFGGFLANSLAIMTDAAHLLSDLASFLISIFALYLSQRAPTSRLSFGFHRAEILGALVSVIMIWILTGILIYEAVNRIRNPEVVDGKLMLIVAGAGLGVNIVMGFVLHQSGHSHSHGLGGGSHSHSHSHGKPKKAKKQKSLSLNNNDDIGAGIQQHLLIDDSHDGHGHSHGDGHGHAHGDSDLHEDEAAHDPAHVANINVSAAFVHVLGDGIQSIGVMIAAGLIWYNPEFHYADPICTFIFSILVLFTTARLVQQSVGVLMEGAPDGLDPEEIENALHKVVGVLEVHDLHVWSLSVGKPSLSVHLISADTEEARDVLMHATMMLGKRFNIHHCTIQVEKLHDQIHCNTHFSRGMEAV
jgi:zinc transporter 2